jgi:hypothetical protein
MVGSKKPHFRMMAPTTIILPPGNLGAWEPGRLGVWEPWHLRFVGVELSTEMKSKKITTLEEFFALPAAPKY